MIQGVCTKYGLTKMFVESKVEVWVCDVTVGGSKLVCSADQNGRWEVERCC